MTKGVYDRTPQTRAKLRAVNLGRRFTPEQLTRVRAARRARAAPLGARRPRQCYVLVKVAQPDIWQKEHRVVMRLAQDDPRIVHHIDGDRTNNSPENLEVLSVSEHTSHHNASPFDYGLRCCGFCEREFGAKRAWQKFCSPICRKRQTY